MEEKKGERKRGKESGWKEGREEARKKEATYQNGFQASHVNFIHIEKLLTSQSAQEHKKRETSPLW